MAVVGAEGGSLPITAQQEHFSLAFTRMVTYAAGFSIKGHETDFDGVDITIVSSAEYETYYCPEFELQLKCTTQQHLLKEDHMAWSMEVKPYRKLTHPKRYNPAVLGVLLIPDEQGTLLEQDEGALLTRSRMYWEWASRLPPLPDGQESKTVHLPRANLFDVPQLQNIFATLGEGGDW
ncbi:DUF4365 domain-containing protein [Streptomyces erythrochromogenes]|uniref:DUF4365 domain-containing protein n=1 Tax=Streptomyces erythrochromogenes TaxID=285574 RepID=UPI0033DD72AC